MSYLSSNSDYGDSNNEQVFHRANKNRPREMSSKKPVSALMNIFEVKKKHARDPRFDNLSGTFEKEHFEEHYSFLNDVKKQEMLELEKELRNTSDSKRKKQIIFLLRRMKNMEVTEKLKAKKKENESAMKEAVIRTLKEGKKPYYPNKSEVRKQELVTQFKELKKSGKLEKYMERRRKKLLAKDRKKFGKKTHTENT